MVWPLNWGSGNVTLIAATRPSWTSDFSARSWPVLASLASFLVPASSVSLTTLPSARSNPDTWVPPSVVGMVLTKLATIGVVALDPPHGDVDRALALDERHLALDGNLLLEGPGAVQRDDLGDRLADGQRLDQVGQAALGDELLGLTARAHACRSGGP